MPGYENFCAPPLYSPEEMAECLKNFPTKEQCGERLYSPGGGNEIDGGVIARGAIEAVMLPKKQDPYAQIRTMTRNIEYLTGKLLDEDIVPDRVVLVSTDSQEPSIRFVWTHICDFYAAKNFFTKFMRVGEPGTGNDNWLILTHNEITMATYMDYLFLVHDPDRRLW